MEKDEKRPFGKMDIWTEVPMKPEYKFISKNRKIFNEIQERFFVKNNYSSQRIEEHLAVGHGGTRATYKQVSDKYHSIKRCLVDKFVKMCKTCKTRRLSSKPLAIRPIISKFFMQRLQ
ncbi:14178_t:CDS:2, partial [Racocetra persica]